MGTPLIKTLIIEDEQLARRELRLLLQPHKAIEIIGEAISPARALEAIEELKPNLIFLDVNLRGGSGFEVLKSLEPPRPHIIFTTAHTDFAIQAFDFDAVDYLLKPIQPERLCRALEKLALNEDSETTIEKPLQPDARVFLKDSEVCCLVALAEIWLIESEGNYSRVHTSQGSHLVHKSLSLLEVRLPQSVFFRANRSQIINLEALQKIDPWFSNTLRATLKNGFLVEFSRRASQEFRESRSL
jgi:two-component system LytT family response regulator